jgi:hypothetical protein
VNSLEQVLARLEPLSLRDRRWIVERLPEQVKAKLISDTSRTAVPLQQETPSMPAITPASIDHSVAELAPTVVARVLLAEPVWVIAAVLRTGPLPWCRQVMSLLPSMVRSTVQVTLQDQQGLASPVITSLCKAVLARVQELPQAQASNNATSRVKQWLAAFASRWSSST